MERYTDSHCLVTRSFDEVIGFLESIREVGIVVHISESIILRKERESWRRRLFPWIEIPVIVVDVICAIVFDISMKYGKCQYRTGESSIRTDFITVLIEYDISLWLICTKQGEDI